MKEVYLCSEYLQSHPLFKSFGSDMASLAERDYPGQGVFKDCMIPVIDLDSYEISLRKSNDCTSDGVIGIANVSRCDLTDRRLLLSELRIGYQNHRNLDFHNIKRKYVHSVDILRELDPDTRIDSEFALIFKKTKVQASQRLFWSWAKEPTKRDAANWKAYDPESFCNYINYGKELPLHPTRETLTLVEGWCSKCVTGYNELSKLKESVEMYWAKLKLRYLLPDMQYVSKELSAYLVALSVPPGDEGELFRLEKSEIEQIIRICEK